MRCASLRLWRAAPVHSPIRDRISGSKQPCTIGDLFSSVRDQSAWLLPGAVFTPADNRRSRPSRQNPLPSSRPKCGQLSFMSPAPAPSREHNSGCAQIHQTGWPLPSPEPSKPPRRAAGLRVLVDYPCPQRAAEIVGGRSGGGSCCGSGLDRSRRFYRDVLGLPSTGSSASGRSGVVFFLGPGCPGLRAW